MPELKDAQVRRKEIEEKKRREKLEKEFSDKQELQNKILAASEKYADSLNKAQIIIDGKLQSLYISIADSDKREHKTVLLAAEDYKALFSQMDSIESAIIKNMLFEYVDNHQDIKQLYDNKYHVIYGWSLLADKIYLEVIW
ncbi:hypothetical protein LY28_02689 [Ruminiclostridium sufflavum DSM 19573]|uniref:Uncharacterized protein n=1 Tax=Ruminiclostridium sufflavum DSM 19573 TaxID=1121337 RepID=A0A318XK82_9FIRM|nr:hypothetical protein [Ruminiclostridium sufflavum]PYG86868.1 hypothetical protein LY28_02689 [Ruminiclostridium sufflavum DSM 19573]